MKTNVEKLSCVLQSEIVSSTVLSVRVEGRGEKGEGKEKKERGKVSDLVKEI